MRAVGHTRVVRSCSAVIALKLERLVWKAAQQYEPSGDPMPERGASEEPAPPRTDRPLRQVVVYLESRMRSPSPSPWRYHTPASHR
jgi:hypothetical protein